MSPIRIAGKECNPECPLCGKTFVKIANAGEFFFVCISCTVSINVNDPSIHLWDSYKPEDEELMCINQKCGEAMSFFFRSDGFMKGYCRKCKSSVATEELPPRIDKPKYTAPYEEGGVPYYDK